MPSIGIATPSLLLLPNLDRFLAPWGRPVPVAGAADLSMVAGWAGAADADRARRAAVEFGVPFLTLSPGPLNPARSPQSDPLPTMLWSLAGDDRGDWRDGTLPSRFEALVAAHGDATATTTALLGSVRSMIDARYAEGGPCVLVIDETSQSSTAEAMLEAAIAENSGSLVAILAPRDGSGALADRARRDRIDYLPADGPLPRPSRLYTVASDAGWEALVVGIPVTCFGMPFYAGWGLTDDRVACHRRSARPSLAALAATVYERYPRYVDPVHGTDSTALEIAGRIAALEARDRANAGEAIMLGVSRWKRPFLTPFLTSSRGSLRYANFARRRVVETARQRKARLLVWAAREPAWLMPVAVAAGVSCTRVEDGFLRSVGLGSDYIPALSLVVDDLGIYFDSTHESGLERILATHAFPLELLEAAARLRALLVERRLTKYNIAASGRVAPTLPVATEGRRVVLVPGQVEDDASIRLGSPEIRTNLALLEAARAAAPDAVILYKPHPDVESGNRPGIVPKAAVERLADAVLSGWDAPTALDHADEVHTMTSLLGFEALMRGKRVATYGLPFYAGLGLTTDRHAWPRPRRPATLDTLVAATFLLYPRYRDPVHDLPITAFDVLTILDRKLQEAGGRAQRAGRIGRWIALTLKSR